MSELGDDPYSSRLEDWYLMTGTVEEYICDVALLMHYPTEISIIVEPGCRWLSCKPSHTTEGRVLLLRKYNHQ